MEGAANFSPILSCTGAIVKVDLDGQTSLGFPLSRMQLTFAQTFTVIQSTQNLEKMEYTFFITLF